MSRIEIEARRTLLDRKEMLRRAHSASLAEAAPGVKVPEGLLAGTVACELAEVEAALGRIAEGRYGTCVTCGGPLGLQRLRAIPEARFCVGCSGPRPGDH